MQGESCKYLEINAGEFGSEVQGRMAGASDIWRDPEADFAGGRTRPIAEVPARLLSGNKKIAPANHFANLARDQDATPTVERG